MDKANLADEKWLERFMTRRAAGLTIIELENTSLSRAITPSPITAEVFFQNLKVAHLTLRLFSSSFHLELKQKRAKRSTEFPNSWWPKRHKTDRRLVLIATLVHFLDPELLAEQISDDGITLLKTHHSAVSNSPNLNIRIKNPITTNFNLVDVV